MLTLKTITQEIYITNMSISIYAYTIKLVIVALSPYTDHNIPK
jgi:hypothetical protein